MDIRQLISEFKATINYLTSVNLPRKLLIWKIQRNEREEGEKERARGEMGRSCTVTEVCWKGKRCREKEKGREKEKNEASDG